MSTVPQLNITFCAECHDKEDCCDAGECLAKVAIYCHECSKAGGANMPVYHSAPVCSSDGDRTP